MPRAPGALSGFAVHIALGAEVDRGHSEGKTNKNADVINKETGVQGVQ